jgi:hypothetical protein
MKVEDIREVTCGYMYQLYSKFLLDSLFQNYLIIETLIALTKED